MKVLIVGAGAVGSVYGYLASRAGHEVTFLVKPKHLSEIQNGIVLYEWKGRKNLCNEFKSFSALDSLEGISQKTFDQVLITLPSNRFQEGNWLESFLQSLEKGSPEATIISLQPGPRDRAFFLRILPKTFEKKWVWGSIPFISYLAPMPGESFPQTGYAFAIPPLSRARWWGPDPARTTTICEFWIHAGIPGVQPPEAERSQLLGESLLRGVVAGLEHSDWSFDRFLMGEGIHLASSAIRELSAIVAADEKQKDPCTSLWGKWLTSPMGIRWSLRLLKAIFPFDFESFLRVHFTKVENQMHQNLTDLIDIGSRLRLPTTNLKLLHRIKRAAPPSPDLDVQKT